MPNVSVIMPVRNEEAFIVRSLGAMLSQDYSSERLEIIVVDGMSKDRTRDVIAEMVVGSAVTVRVLDNPKCIVPAAMNIGIGAAKGDIILRMDGHTLAPPDYVSRCVETLETTSADNVGGLVEYVGSDAVSRAAGLAAQSKFGCGGAPARSAKEGPVDTVSFGCWRREAFEKFGLFDESFIRTQDSEFNYRTRLLGGTVWMNPEIRTKYFNRASLRKLAKQYFEYGFWKTRLMFKLKDLSQRRRERGDQAIAHEIHETSRKKRIAHGKHGITRKIDAPTNNQQRTTNNLQPRRVCATDEERRTKNDEPATCSHGVSALLTNNQQPSLPTARLHWRHMMPPLLVVGLLFSLFVIGFSLVLGMGPVGLILGLTLPAAYAAGCIMGSVYLAATKRAWGYFPLFVLIFPILHISWGTGFLVGLVQKPRVAVGTS